MKTTQYALLPLFLAAALCGYARPARAQTPEYIVILLDQTGSMCNDEIPCKPNYFWTNAIADAQSWVSDAAATYTDHPRYYSIWTFKDTQDGAQNNSMRIWPDAANSATSCGAAGFSIPVPGTYDAASKFCKLATTKAAFIQLNKVIASIEAAQPPQPTWLTPLADSVCRGISAAWSAQATANRTLILESDGGENDSDSAMIKCFGADSVNDNITDINTLQAARLANTPDWGFDVGSWEAMVMRRGARLISVPANPDMGIWEQNSTVPPALVSTDSFPNQLALNVSVHYELCKPNDPNSCPVPSVPVAPTPLTNLKAAPALRIDGSQVSATTVATLGNIAARSTARAQTTGFVTPVPSLDRHQLGFFRSLGRINAKSKLREVTIDPTVVYGVNHRLAGDVDDSGCVDRADYNILTQNDVWMQRAVQPLQIAIRADLNRDGWVNPKDRDIVLANWGKGCVNNPGPKPVP